ncbi:MAG: hypothetical protein ACK5H2_11865 [Beutenbergiaceae bacterium]
MSQPSDADGEPTEAEVDRRFAELTADLAPDPLPRMSDTPSPAGSGPRDYRVAEEPDEGYVPPEPAPLSSIDPLQLFAWAGAIGGPIAMVVLVVLWPTAPFLLWLTALIATLVGWGIVIWRLPRQPRDSDDDGAVL